MSTWQAQTIVSLLERDPALRVFNVWTLVDRNLALPEGVASWSVPSLVALRGTTLGGLDFGVYDGALMGGNRVAVRNGQLVPLSRDEWKSIPIEEEFDGLLYLGPPASMTTAPVPAALCQDVEFV